MEKQGEYGVEALDDLSSKKTILILSSIASKIRDRQDRDGIMENTIKDILNDKQL